MRPGMTERDAAALLGYAGEPLSMHPIVASGAPGQSINGLRSPGGRQVAIGDGISCGIGYWGSLCCRAGLVEDAAGIDFFTNYVRPCFLAQAAWYATIGIGVTGGEVAAAVETVLTGAGATFRPMLNPGHLISYDEWVHSPIEPGSDVPLASGMALQCDIIPTPLPAGTALNCEDSIVLADEALRADIAARHPDSGAGSIATVTSCRTNSASRCGRRHCRSRWPMPIFRPLGFLPRWSARWPRSPAIVISV